MVSKLRRTHAGVLLLLLLVTSLSTVHAQDAGIISRNDPLEIIQETFVSLRRNHYFWTNPGREPVDSYRQETPQPVLYIDGTSGLYNPVYAHLGMPIVLSDRIDNWPIGLAQYFLLDLSLQYSGVRYRLSDTNIADSDPEYDDGDEQSVIAVSPTFAISAYAPLQLPLVTQIGVAIHDLQIDGVFDEDRLSQLGSDGEYRSVQLFYFAEVDTRYVTARSLLFTPFARAEIDSIYTDLLLRFIEGWAVGLATRYGGGIGDSPATYSAKPQLSFTTDEFEFDFVIDLEPVDAPGEITSAWRSALDVPWRIDTFFTLDFLGIHPAVPTPGEGLEIDFWFYPNERLFEPYGTGAGISYWGGGDITGRVGVGWNTIRNEFGRSSRGLDIRFGFLLYR